MEVARVTEVAGLSACLMTAGFALFLEKCMEPGMVLRRYKLLLLLLWMRNWRRRDRWRRPMLKPLGLCVYCYTFWLALASWVLCYGVASPWFFLHVGGVFAFLFLLIKIQ